MALKQRASPRPSPAGGKRAGSEVSPRPRGSGLGADGGLGEEGGGSPVGNDLALTLVGHPFTPIGMGQQLRSHMAAMAAVGLDYRVLDIFRHSGRIDDAHMAVLGDRERLDAPSGGIRIFHVNGDEVDRVVSAFEALGGRFAAGYNVIVPAWELPRYPKVWAAELARFDEVWAISQFVQDSLAAAGVRSHLIGQSVEPEPGPLLPRRWFGIRESAFVLLHFFDLSSHAERKNPLAVLDLFARLRAARPLADCQLVVKVKDGERPGLEWAAELPALPGLQVLSDPLDTLATTSLIAACDCFVSLHRAEGFGRGLGEAMALGRLALGTAWSGNLDFMTAQNAILVPADLVPVRASDYPHGRGQRWAQPNVEWAAAALLALLDDPEARRRRAEQGRRDVLRTHGHRAVGLRVLDLLERIVPKLTQAQATRVAAC